MKQFIKSITRKLGLDISRYNAASQEPVVSIRPDNGSRGDVLLSYIIEPFLIESYESISKDHTHDWESFQIGKTFMELGYGLDVIDYRNNNFIPEKNYSFFVGARTNFERIARNLNENCIKIVHLDTSHWIFNNYQTYRRCLNLQQRRGATINIEMQKIVEYNLAIETADFATFLGNEFTRRTYDYAEKPMFSIPVSTCATYPWANDKDYESCRKNFLWFGSAGMVHKGLDLVLEAFADMPDFNLTICGPLHHEADFVEAYYKELFHTPNIHTIGWIDVTSQEFANVTGSCVGLVYPSCAEGQCGAVVNCLHAGLIPIISNESGVDINDFGILLEECSLNEIKRSIQAIAALPTELLESMSRKAWEYARTHHTRERFTQEYNKAINEVIVNSISQNVTKEMN